MGNAESSGLERQQGSTMGLLVQDVVDGRSSSIVVNSRKVGVTSSRDQAKYVLPEHIDALVRLLVSRDAAKLHTLNLFETYLGSGNLALLADALATGAATGLTVLDLTCCEMKDSALIKLAPALPASLVELYLGNRKACIDYARESARFGEKGVKALAQKLPVLKQLRVLFICNVLDSKGALALAQALNTLSLSSLELPSGNIGISRGHLPDIRAPEALQTLFGAVPGETLARLSLPGNRLGNAGIGLLARALERLVVLEMLDVSEVGMTEEGMRLIAPALPLAGSLVELWVECNPIGDAGAVALAAAIVEAAAAAAVDAKTPGSIRLRDLGVCSCAIGVLGMRRLSEASVHMAPADYMHGVKSSGYRDTNFNVYHSGSQSRDFQNSAEFEAPPKPKHTPAPAAAAPAAAAAAAPAAAAAAAAAAPAAAAPAVAAPAAARPAASAATSAGIPLRETAPLRETMKQLEATVASLRAHIDRVTRAQNDRIDRLERTNSELVAKLMELLAANGASTKSLAEFIHTDVPGPTGSASSPGSTSDDL